MLFWPFLKNYSEARHIRDREKCVFCEKTCFFNKNARYPRENSFYALEGASKWVSKFLDMTVENTSKIVKVRTVTSPPEGLDILEAFFRPHAQSLQYQWISL